MGLHKPYLTARYLPRSGPVDEIIYPPHVHRSDSVQVAQHFEGFEVMVALYHGDERSPPAAGEADVGQGLSEGSTHTTDEVPTA